MICRGVLDHLLPPLLNRYNSAVIASATLSPNLGDSKVMAADCRLFSSPVEVPAVAVPCAAAPLHVRQERAGLGQDETGQGALSYSLGLIDGLSCSRATL